MELGFFDAANKYQAQQIVSGVMTGNNTAPQKLTIKPPKTDVNVFLYMSGAGQKINKTVLLKAGGVVTPPVDPMPTKTVVAKIAVYSDGTIEKIS